MTSNMETFDGERLFFYWLMTTEGEHDKLVIISFYFSIGTDGGSGWKGK